MSIKYGKMTHKSLRTFTITKKIAKHGNQAVILIPRFLQEDLKPKTIVEVKINIVREAENDIKI